MLRGLSHLVLYRVVYHFLTVDPVSLRTLGDVVQLICVSWVLYLRVSGQFHLIVGLLHLFGFRLPESNHLYFLSSSFTDLWRRTNIYWKDYMQKLVYFPSFFVLRRLGQAPGMLLATSIVMFATWVLHGYQTFWIWGRASYSAVDFLFWFLLGSLVLASTGYDLYRPRVAKTRSGWSLRRGLGTAMVFLTIGIFFTLWQSESISYFVEGMGYARNVDLRGVLLLLGVITTCVAIGGGTWGKPNLEDVKPTSRTLGQDLRAGAWHLGGLGVLLIIGDGGVQRAMGPRVGEFFSRVSGNSENTMDALQMVRGYYEDLGKNDQITGQGWYGEDRAPDDWVSLNFTAAYKERNDFELEDLQPNVTVKFKGVPFSTNSFGMHDKEYALAKPPGVYRIAVLGSSIAMAPGVVGDSSWEAILEDRLNARYSASGRRYEVLNFGISAFGMLQMVEKLGREVMAFQPDLVLFVSAPPDHMWTARNVQLAVNRGIPIPYEGLRRMVTRYRLSPPITMGTAYRRIAPVMDSVLASAIDRADSMLATGHARGSLLVFRLPTFPRVTDRVLQHEAERAGWPIVDLTEPYGGRDETQYRLRWFDKHFNAAGNLLVGNLLFAELERRADEFALPLGRTPATGERPARRP